jgi:membrane protein implicated in regulation of membrane protease activity
MALEDVLRAVLSWQGVAVWVAAVLLWQMFKVAVLHASRRNPGRAALALLPVLGLALAAGGLLDWAVVLWLLSALAVAVVWTARRDARNEGSEGETHARG